MYRDLTGATEACQDEDFNLFYIGSFASTGLYHGGTMLLPCSRRGCRVDTWVCRHLPGCIFRTQYIPGRDTVQCTPRHEHGRATVEYGTSWIERSRARYEHGRPRCEHGRDMDVTRFIPVEHSMITVALRCQYRSPGCDTIETRHIPVDHGMAYGWYKYRGSFPEVVAPPMLWGLGSHSPGLHFFCCLERLSIFISPPHGWKEVGTANVEPPEVSSSSVLSDSSLTFFRGALAEALVTTTNFFAGIFFAGIFFFHFQERCEHLKWQSRYDVET